MPEFLVAAVAGVVAWWLYGKWKASRGPERMARAGALVGTIGRILLAVPILWAVGAMAQGCEDEEAVDPWDPATADGNADFGADPDGGDEPERMTCGSWREEDCPPYPSVLIPGDGTP